MSKTGWLVVSGLVVGILLMSGTRFIRDTRGFRNNNPGNLKELPDDTTDWIGERVTDDDPVFEEFETMEAGIRALSKVLDSYQRMGFVNIDSIISRYAPGNENDTAAYIDAVAGWLDVDPYDTIVLPDRKVDVMQAIITMENGYNPFAASWVQWVINKPDEFFA